MKIRMAMIGGGEGSFIGPVHRMAALLDGHIEIVAGAFSSDSEVSERSGAALGLEASRVYSDWKTLLAVESALPQEIRPHLISIVTPNFLHYDQIMESLDAGFNVICDKPLCMYLSEAISIEERINSSGQLFCITHNYTGYPMVKQARELIRDGSLGIIRKISVEYFQGWLATKLEDTGHKQAEWRSDPSKAGKSGCMADIGTHAFNLAEYISGEKVMEVFAQLNRIVDTRVLDDDGTVIMNFENGARGSLLASQVATGEENNLKIRVYGTRGSIVWEQMNPNSLTVRWIDKPYEVYRTATAYPQIGKFSDMHSRLPGGHPEGFIEAFANLYRNFAISITSRKSQRSGTSVYDYPGIYDGVRGMKFLDAVVRSSNEKQWVVL